MTAVGERRPDTPRRDRRAGLVGLGVLVVLFVAGLAWAKWLPYTEKAGGLSRTHTWAGDPVFAAAGEPGAAPSWAGAWHFAVTYFQAVWKAAVVALLVAAAIDALVPRAWLLSVLNRRSRVGQSVAGGLTALPSLMCSCCTAPVAVGLRRRGAAVAASLAYWVGNPVLNPAVLVFLFLVAPWQFGVVRIVVGLLLVVGGTALVARLAGDRPSCRPGCRPGCGPTSRRMPCASVSCRCATCVRWPASPSSWCPSTCWSCCCSPAQRLAVGLPRADARLGFAAVLVAAVIGTLLVIPTGGEIPVVLALAAAGAGAGHRGRPADHPAGAQRAVDGHGRAGLLLAGDHGDGRGRRGRRAGLRCAAGGAVVTRRRAGPRSAQAAPPAEPWIGGLRRPTRGRRNRGGHPVMSEALWAERALPVGRDGWQSLLSVTVTRTADLTRSAAGSPPRSPAGRRPSTRTTRTSRSCCWPSRSWPPTGCGTAGHRSRSPSTATGAGWLLVVSDASTERPPSPAVDRDPATGGLGLYLVARLATAHGWIAASGRKHVWACLRHAAVA